MSDVPMISLLSDDELDAVTGGGNLRVRVWQNASGGSSFAFAGRGGPAEAESGAGGTATATGGAGGSATSGPGGAGGIATADITIVD
jgi:hypothetical protein